MSDNPIKAAALEYLERGWSTIALCPFDHAGVSAVHKQICNSPGKAPQMGWKEFQTRRPTPAELQEMWTRFPNANVGVCMGPVSGIVGLDIDGEPGEALLDEACGEELPDTCEFTTPGGGRRLLFAIPPGVQCPGPTHSCAAGRHSGMSFLSQGSQTVMPPSRHANGGYYAWKQYASPADRPPQTVPKWLIDWAIRQNQRNRVANTQVSAVGEQIRDGERDQTLTRLAGSMRRHGATREEMLAALEVANHRCQPPLPQAQIEKIAESVSKYTPAQVNPNRMPVEKPKPTASLIRANEIELQEIKWLWETWIPQGKLVALDGDPGLGKSTMLLDLAARVSRGAPMPDGTPGTIANVLLSTAEDCLEDTIGPRLAEAGADLEKVIIFDQVKQGEDSRPLTLPDDLPMVKEVIRTNQIKLWIIDPLMSFLAGSVDSCNDQDVKRCFHKLYLVAKETDCTILFLRHLNKAAGTKAIYRGTGSIGIIGAARAGMMVVQDPDRADEKILICQKTNIAAMPLSLRFRLEPTHRKVCRVVWTGTSTAKADDLLTIQATPEEKDERKDAVEFLEDLLAEGQKPRKEVIRAARAAGFSDNSIKTARTKLKIQFQKIGFGGQSIAYWRLPHTPESPQTNHPTIHDPDAEDAA